MSCSCAPRGAPAPPAPPAPVYFTASLSGFVFAKQTVDTPLPFNTVVAGGGGFNVYTGAFTAPVSGLYDFSASLSLATNDSFASYLYLSLAVNGNVSPDARGAGYGVPGTRSSVQASLTSYLISLSAGDVVQTDYRSNCTTANTTFDSAFFSGRLVASEPSWFTAVSKPLFFSPYIVLPITTGLPYPFPIVSGGNVDGAYSLYASAYTAPSAGVYSFSFNIETTRTTTTVLAVNGAAVASTLNAQGRPTSATVTCGLPAYLLSLNAGDVVQLIYSLPVSAGYVYIAYFCGRKLP